MGRIDVWVRTHVPVVSHRSPCSRVVFQKFSPRHIPSIKTSTDHQKKKNVLGVPSALCRSVEKSHNVTNTAR